MKKRTGRINNYFSHEIVFPYILTTPHLILYDRFCLFVSCIHIHAGCIGKVLILVNHYVVASRVYVYTGNTLGFYFVCYWGSGFLCGGKVLTNVISSERRGSGKDVNSVVP